MANEHTTSTSGSAAEAPMKIPYSLTAAYGEAKFDEMYEKALLRKRLFKEYITRHQVLERLNQAIESLYDCDALPEDPMEYITAYVKAPPPNGQKSTLAGNRTGPVLSTSGSTRGGASTPSKQ